MSHELLPPATSPAAAAMAMVSRSKKSRVEAEDHISRLPDAVLGEIISLLPTKDGARTQAIASRWRHLWRSAPLNIELDQGHGLWRQIQLRQVTGMLSSHPGPGRRFSFPTDYFTDAAAATLDGWLLAPALDYLRELEILYRFWLPSRRRNQIQRPPLPASARRFSSSLRVASFGGCNFPDGDAGGDALQLPHLKHLSLFNVRISESSLHGLLAGCPVLQSLMLAEDITGCSCIRIVSSTIRTIGVRYSSLSGDAMLQQLIIEDAPCLERLLLFGQIFYEDMVISVISAPKLYVLGQLPVEHQPTLKFDTTVFQGSRVVNSTMPVPSVKVLALTHNDLSLDVVIDFMKCFPCLENLCIKITKMDRESSKVTNAWFHKHRNLIGTLDIRLKKIVVTVYRGNRAHVNFAKFFVLNARVLESMVVEVACINNNEVWVQRQKKLLQIENRASRGAQFHFVHHFGRFASLERIWYEQVHDLSTIDPFAGFDRLT